MQDAELFTYVSEADMRQVLEATYPGVKEVDTRIDNEDLLFEAERDGKVDFTFQVWKYTHPKRGDLWVVNRARVTYED